MKQQPQPGQVWRKGDGLEYRVFAVGRYRITGFIQCDRWYCNREDWAAWSADAELVAGPGSDEQLTKGTGDV